MKNEQRLQNWKQSLAIGAQGVAEVSDFLKCDLVRKNWLDTHFVHNVEQDVRYQGSDIDLLWVVPVNNFLRCLTIEVKTDRNNHTGNFFFETVSVESRDKPGAFIITRAEWLFYYFINSKQLYCFPMADLKPWFVKNENEFEERRAYSEDNDKKLNWSTVGKIIPIDKVINEISTSRIFRMRGDLWEKV
jgi:hypothetical protein